MATKIDWDGDSDRLKVGDRVRHVDYGATGTLVRQGYATDEGGRTFVVLWDGEVEVSLIAAELVRTIR